MMAIYLPAAVIGLALAIAEVKAKTKQSVATTRPFRPQEVDESGPTARDRQVLHPPDRTGSIRGEQRATRPASDAARGGHQSWQWHLKHARTYRDGSPSPSPPSSRPSW